MKRIAVYLEQHPKWRHTPLSSKLVCVRDSIDALSDLDAEKYSTYMDSCIKLVEWVSPLQDPLDPNIQVPDALYTDGAYFWDGMLSYFVKSYSADLPSEFKKHIETKQVNVVNVEDMNYLEIYKDLVNDIRNGDFSKVVSL